MPSVISTGGQTVYKNSYRSSAQVRLSLRANGEELPTIITPEGGTVPAGFYAPLVAPVVTDAGAGNVPAGYYQYIYVYASSRYPFVENDITGGGLEYPRSNPSPAGAVNVVGSSTVNVACATTQRLDADYIWIYRTIGQTTAALAQAQAEAGRFFYVGSEANDPSVPTITIIDNALADTGEQVEVDNYPCPTFRYLEFDGFYWWGWGNIPFTCQVTLNGTSVITISGTEVWYSGRDGQTVTLDGVSSGGYDQRGSFYFHWLSGTTCELCTDPELTTPATIAASGTTQMTLRGPQTTLFRSKARNPLSWGVTTELVDGTRVSELFALKIGGGYGTGITLIPNERILKLDTEGPQKSYALDLNAADTSDFLGTLRTLDEAQSTSANFSQFPMRHVNRQTTATSVNGKANQILSADSQSQIPIGDNVIRTLRRVKPESSDYFHGVFDYRTELNCWFIKTTDSPDEVDTLIYHHAPTGSWGTLYSPGVNASAMIFDYDTRQHFTLLGDDSGRLSIGFDKNLYQDFPDISLGEDMLMQFDPLVGFYGGWLVGVPTLEENVFINVLGATLVSLVVFDTSDYIVGQRVWLSALHNFPGTGNATITEIVNGNLMQADADETIGFAPTPTTAITRQWRNQPFYAASADGQDMWLICGYDGWINAESSGAGPAPAGYVWAAFQTDPDPSVNWMGLYGINLTTGEYGGLSNTAVQSWTAVQGTTPALLRRYFNSGTPEATKRTVEMWATIKNTSPTGTLRGRFIQEYDEYGALTPVVSNLLKQDDLGSNPNPQPGITGSMRYFTKSPPSILLPALGVDIVEAGLKAFQIYDFTVMQHKA